MSSSHPPTARCTTNTHMPGQVGEVASHRALHRFITGQFVSHGQVLYEHPHPTVSRLVCLRVRHPSALQSHKRYKNAVSRSRIRRGRHSLVRRERKWEAHSPAAARGLQSLEWKRLRQIAGLNPWGEQLLYRLRQHALSTFDPTQACLGCPHSDCVGQRDVDIYHVFWACPAAATLRNRFLTTWRSAGLILPDIELTFFGLHLPGVPPRFAQVSDDLFPFHRSVEALRLTEALTLSVEACWRLGVVLLFHAIWRWRVAYFDPHNSVSTPYHQAVLTTRLRHGYGTVIYRLPATISLKAAPQAAQVAQQVLIRPNLAPTDPDLLSGNVTYLLFFDGGPRDNPGPGGSGAVVIRVGGGVAEYAVCWVGSMSYAAISTTNNLAENLGLLMGIKECRKRKWAPLHVIGDSQVIIHQQKTRLPPKAKHLRPLYWQIRREADRLEVTAWHHHVREFNKTADKLANLAMDTRLSFQAMPSRTLPSPTDWTLIHSLVAGDVDHWINTINVESFSRPATPTS